MSREWCLAMTFCCVDLPFRSHTRAGWMRGAIDQRGSAMSSRCAHAPERQAKADSGRPRAVLRQRGLPTAVIACQWTQPTALHATPVARLCDSQQVALNGCSRAERLAHLDPLQNFKSLLSLQSFRPRYSDGVIRKARLKWRTIWLASEKPQLSATSLSGMSVLSVSMRLARN